MILGIRRRYKRTAYAVRKFLAGAFMRAVLSVATGCCFVGQASGMPGGAAAPPLPDAEGGVPGGAVRVVDAGMHAVVAPDDRRLAYVVPHGDGSTLWLADVRGQWPPVALTERREGRFDDFPAFSPDGARIYFQRKEGGRCNIWCLEIRSRRETRITAGDGMDFHPSVSPDGRKLAFDSNRAGSYDIWIKDLSEGSLRRITDWPSHEFYPCWSPKGRALAFSASRGGRFDVWVRILSGRGRYVRISNGEGVSAHPAWSPDGTFLAYDSDAGGEGVSIWLADMRTRLVSPLRIGGRLCRGEHPRWFGKGVLSWTLPSRIAGAAPRVMKMELPASLFSKPSARTAPVGAKSTPAAAAAPAAVAGNAVASGPAGRAERRGAAHSSKGGLRILECFPSPNSRVDLSRASVAVVFDRDVYAVDDLSRYVMMVDENGVVVDVACDYNPNLRRLDIVPVDGLHRGGRYLVTIARGLPAADESVLEKAFSWKFSVKGPPPMVRPVAADAGKSASGAGRPDSVRGFRLVSLSPHPDEEVPAGERRIECVFSRSLDPSTVDAKSLLLFDEHGENVPGELRFPPGGTKLVLVPYEPLEEGGPYRVFLSRRLRSSDGSPIEGRRMWQFSCRPATPLRLADYSPKGYLGPSPTITLKFSRRVDRKSLRRSRIFLEGPDGARYEGSVMLASDGETLAFIPHRQLPDSTTFRLRLPASITDESGNSLDCKKPLVFKTHYRGMKDDGAIDGIFARHGLGNPVKRLHRMAAGGRDTAGGLFRHEAPHGGVSAGTADGVTARYLRGAAAGLDPEAEVQPGSPLYRGLLRFMKRGYLDSDLCFDLRERRPISRYKASLLLQSASRSLELMLPADRRLLARMGRMVGDLALGRTFLDGAAAGGKG